MKFNEILRSEMKKQKVTQVELSKVINISQGNLSQFLTGKAPMPIKKIEKAFEYLNIEFLNKSEIPATIPADQNVPGQVSACPFL